MSEPEVSVVADASKAKEEPSMRPRIGCIVHYQAFGTPGGEYRSVPRAAIVTEVTDDETVSVCVLNPTGLFFNAGLKFDDGDRPKGGTWRWTGA